MHIVQSKPVRVAVHASDVFTQVGITRYLENAPEVEVLPSGRQEGADVVVLAPERLTPGAFAEMRTHTRTTGPATVLLADQVSETDLLAAAQCGVATVLSRHAATGDNLVRTVLAAARRKATPTSPRGEALRHLDELLQDGEAPRGRGAAGLSPREVDVLRLMSEGFDTDEIAAKLCYSGRTVKNIIYGVTSRLRVRNRSHAVACAMRAGVI